MQNIKIEKIENGYSVRFPYALKDSFKKALPSAKWNANSKCWTVGIRSLKKVEAWAETAEEVAEQIAEEKKAKDELEATEAEFNQAIAELKRIKAEITETQKYIEKTKKVLAEIAEIKEKVTNAKSELKEEREVQADLSNKIDEILNGILDFDAINEAISKMRRMRASAVTSKNRAVFEEAQNAINEQRQKLKKAGLGSRGLDDLWKINWNRPDRDRISDCRDIKDIYTIKEENE